MMGVEVTTGTVRCT